MTLPGKSASLENEAVFAATEDDYGTSYYFRGNVENNYVNYSGMCWRIVRVDGNGNIKIVLADANNECNSSGYSITNEYSSYILENQIGFYSMDSYVSSVSSWAASKNLDTSKLYEAEWCYDASIAINNTFEWDDQYNPEYDPYHSISKEFTYGPLSRLENKQPSLKCNFTGELNSVSEKYKSIYGALTADEVVYAGSSYDYRSEFNYYLMTNATGTRENSRGTYWTMSLADYRYEDLVDKNIDYTNLFFVYQSGYVSYDNITGEWGNAHLRPSVVLESGVFATTDVESGYAAGTYQNPFNVE